MGHVAKPSGSGGYGAVQQNGEFRGEENLPERAVGRGKPQEISSPYPLRKGPCQASQTAAAGLREDGWHLPHPEPASASEALQLRRRPQAWGPT